VCACAGFALKTKKAGVAFLKSLPVGTARCWMLPAVAFFGCRDVQANFRRSELAAERDEVT
jgi:hypothetical protein